MHSALLLFYLRTFILVVCQNCYLPDFGNINVRVVLVIIMFDILLTGFSKLLYVSWNLSVLSATFACNSVAKLTKMQ